MFAPFFGEVAEVEKGSPAQEAGLEEEDVVLSFGDNPDPDFSQEFARYLANKSGSNIPVKVWRGGRVIDLSFTPFRWKGFDMFGGNIEPMEVEDVLRIRNLIQGISREASSSSSNDWEIINDTESSDETRDEAKVAKNGSTGKGSGVVKEAATATAFTRRTEKNASEVAGQAQKKRLEIPQVPILASHRKEGLEKKLVLANKLLSAVEADDFGSVERIIESSSDINLCNENGWTAMHMAVWEPKPTIVRYLLEKGCSLTVRNSDGQSPIDLAWEQGNDFRMGNVGSKEIWIIVKRAAEGRGIDLSYLGSQPTREDVPSKDDEEGNDVMQNRTPFSGELVAVRFYVPILLHFLLLFFSMTWILSMVATGGVIYFTLLQDRQEEEVVAYKPASGAEHTQQSR